MSGPRPLFGLSVDCHSRRDGPQGAAGAGREKNRPGGEDVRPAPRRVCVPNGGPNLFANGELEMATVFVWENHFIARPWKGYDPTWTGHSSLCITDNFVDTRAPVDDGTNTGKLVVDESSEALSAASDEFVSFWPGTMQNVGPKDSNGFTFNDGWKIGIQFMAMSKPSIFADVALEGYAPDHV